MRPLHTRPIIVKEEMSVTRISQIQQAERREPQLTKIEPDFYEQAEKYIRNLQRDYEKEYLADSTSPKTVLRAADLQRAKQAVKRIYEARERKIALLALSASTGAVGDKDTSAMTNGERAIYDDLAGILKVGRERHVSCGREARPREAPKSVPSGEMKAEPQLSRESGDAGQLLPGEISINVVGDSSSGTTVGGHHVVSVGAASADTEAESRTKSITVEHAKAHSHTGHHATAAAANASIGVSGAPSEAERSQGAKSIETITIRVIEDIPTFMASDEREYSLVREEVVTMPKDSAEVLCRGKKAVKVGF